MSDRFTIVLNLTSIAPSQYIEQPFNSAVEFNGKLVFFGESGIFEEGGQTDDGTAISAWIDTPLHDFGDYRQKELLAYDIGYEASGDIVVTLYVDEDEGTARSFIHRSVKTGGVQQGGVQTLTRYLHGRGRYWKVRIANYNGSDFSVDYLALAPVLLSRSRKSFGARSTLACATPVIDALIADVPPSLDFSDENNSQYLL